MHPVLFKIGPITIYSYGTFVMLAFVLALYLIKGELRKEPLIKPNQFVDLALYMLVFGLIGSRALHIILNIEFYIENPVRIILLNRGGLAVHGGIILATASAVWFLKKKNLPIWKTGDLIIPYVALGQSIGRIGCFLNGCCFGKVIGARRHPTQLYSVLGLFIIFLILKYLYRRRHFEGKVFVTYFILYSAFRFLVDFLRGDLMPVLFGLNISQFINIIIFSTAVILYKRGQAFSRPIPPQGCS